MLSETCILSSDSRRTNPQNFGLHLQPSVGKKLFPALKRAQSLNPGPALMDAFVSGNAEAAGIVDSWKFNFPITAATSRWVDAPVERSGNMTFTGHEDIEVLFDYIRGNER